MMRDLVHAKWPVAMLLLVLISLPVFSADIKAEDLLRLQPESVETEYCAGTGNTLVLHLRINLMYRNQSDQTIVLPRFRRVSQYVLRREDATHLPEVAYKKVFDRPPMLDMRKLKSDAPDPKLFDLLPAGSSLPSMQSIDIPLGRGTGGMQPGDYSLELWIDHWPGDRSVGERLRNGWISRGVLYMSDLRTDPVKLHIEPVGTAKACRFRID